jgi:hypothetical protein
MNRTVFCIAILAAILVAAAAGAAGITGFKNSSLKIYSDQDGGAEVGRLARNEIKFPARILTYRSDAGLIKATFQFTTGGRDPVSVWVRYRSVRVDEGLTIDVPGCAAPSKSGATVRRGVRGLGKGCK